VTAEEVIALLELRPHPEGGSYRETFRSPYQVDAPRGPRAASTAIWFLLRGGTFSAWHRVASDEVGHHHAGAPVVLHRLSDSGHEAVVLGSDLAAGQRPQVVIRAGIWQAAACEGPGFALCGCTVAPGFDFADFELAERVALQARFPAHAALVARFTRG